MSVLFDQKVKGLHHYHVGKAKSGVVAGAGGVGSNTQSFHSPLYSKYALRAMVEAKLVHQVKGNLYFVHGLLPTFPESLPLPIHPNNKNFNNLGIHSKTYRIQATFSPMLHEQSIGILLASSLNLEIGGKERRKENVVVWRNGIYFEGSFRKQANKTNVSEKILLAFDTRLNQGELICSQEEGEEGTTYPSSPSSLSSSRSYCRAMIGLLESFSGGSVESCEMSCYVNLENARPWYKEKRPWWQCAPLEDPEKSRQRTKEEKEEQEGDGDAVFRTPIEATVMTEADAYFSNSFVSINFDAYMSSRVVFDYDDGFTQVSFGSSPVLLLLLALSLGLLFVSSSKISHYFRFATREGNQMPISYLFMVW
jgi:hypothetical protein